MSLKIDQSASSAGVTMMAWVRPQSSATGIRQVISSDDGGYDWSIMRWGTTWHVFTGAGYADTGLSADVGVWQHIAAVFLPGTGMTFYKNAQEVTISQIGYDTNDNPTSIGDNPGSWTEYFDGDIDEVKIYNTPLSAQDILALYRSSGLVASYPFSEGSGMSTADASGNGNDGTLLNGTSWTPDGKVGYALSFDGVDDYVNLGTDEALQIGDHGYTIATWGKHDGTAQWSMLAADRNSGSGAEGWLVGLTSTGTMVCAVEDAAGNYETVYSSQTYHDTMWHHFACTWEASTQTLTFYVDGTELVPSATYEQGTVGSVAPSTPVNIGRQPDNTSYWSGLIDEVKIYDRALSVSEIQDLAGLGGEGLFATTSFSESSAPLSASGDDLVEVDGASVYINVGESPELNYGIGDFTVMVTARTADAANSGSAGILPAQEAGGVPALPGWLHTAVGIRQGKDLFLYLDGAVQAQKKVGAGRITRLNVNVGLDDVSTHAIIEDVRLFPYALSPDEIAEYSGQ